MNGTQSLTSEEAKSYLLNGGTDSVHVNGLLDIRELKLSTLPAQISCHDLDATGSDLTTLPNGIEVKSRLILDNCNKLEYLPDNLHCGSISLRNCSYLDRLPEGLHTWFLDMNNCQRFKHWPEKANIERGILSLRNCIELQTLPNWLTTLAQLDLAGCVQLKEVPSTITVSGWIDIGGTSITGLPEQLSNTPIHWRSVPVSQRIAFDPQSITADEILVEKNAELRRVMIDRMGYLEFATGAGAKKLDADTDAGGKRELLKIKLKDDEDLVGLACFCPSTSRQYLLRVPPTVRSCHEAAAWLAGFDDPTHYHPLIET